MFNKLILKKYVDIYSFTIEEVEAECMRILETMQRYKYYEEVNCIRMIEAGLDISIGSIGG